MSHGTSAAAISAIEELEAFVRESERRGRKKWGSNWLNEKGAARFLELDAVVRRHCDNLSVKMPIFEIRDKILRPLGFVRIPSVRGKKVLAARIGGRFTETSGGHKLVLLPTPEWDGALQALKERARLADPEPRTFDVIMLELNKTQQAMFCELWNKGSATLERLRELRGSRLVQPDAERKAIDRLAAKVSEITNGKVRIEKQAGGVKLVK